MYFGVGEEATSACNGVNSAEVTDGSLATHKQMITNDCHDTARRDTYSAVILYFNGNRGAKPKACQQVAGGERAVRRALPPVTNREKQLHPGGMPAMGSTFLSSPTARPGVRHYIEHQEEHHRTRSFRDELTDMLKEAGIDYDPTWLD